MIQTSLYCSTFHDRLACEVRVVTGRGACVEIDEPPERRRAAASVEGMRNTNFVFRQNGLTCDPPHAIREGLQIDPRGARRDVHRPGHLPRR
jgi:hypothetical protein